MIGTLLLGAIIGGLLVAFWDDIMDWANAVINAVYDAILAALYAVRTITGAIMRTYVQRSSGVWEERSRIVSESELPSELRSMSLNNPRKVAQWT